MNNVTQHLSHQHALTVLFVIALLSLLVSIPYFIKQHRRYGSPFEFASSAKKKLTVIACIAIVGFSIYYLTPYVSPPSNEIAIVLGDTQNSPKPQVTEDIATEIEGTLLQHKGDDAYSLVDSVKIISATKNPTVISIDPANLELKDIGNNSSDAKRDASYDEKAIEQEINNQYPIENGSNYLEAILTARDNVSPGSNILVIGSGLSDSGDINFSQTNILTNDQSRNQVIQNVSKKYGSDFLDKYNVEFYGLGDTVEPQEPLSILQKDIVQETYNDAIRSLGGSVNINTTTLVGDSVNTNYVVGTTDTGCGDIGLIFDDDSLKFVSNQASFIDESAVKNTLMSVDTLWNKYRDTIQQINIQGYIAHYPDPGNLSQQRADLVKQVLVELGVPSNKITSTGEGFGPYSQDSQNRMVKVTINRNSDQCGN